MLPFFVSTQQPGQLQARHRLEKDNIQQTVRHAGVGRGTVAAAVLLAVADRQHHEGVLQLAVIGGDAQTVPEGAAHGLENRQRVGRCAAAEGHAPPFGDAVGDLGVDARGIDVDAAALGRADDVRCERLCGQLCVKVQELRLRAEVAHIVIAAAAGHAADGGVRAADGTLQYFVQRAVAARDDKGRIRRERAEPGRIVADRCHIGIGKRLLREARVQSACLLRTAAVSGLRIKKHILHTVLSPFGIFKEPLIKLQERSARDFVPN